MPETETPGIRILLDQNVPLSVRRWLRAKSEIWQIVHTSDVGLQGESDAEVFTWAQNNGYLIITFDASFADGRSFPVGRHYGVVRLRVWPTTIEETVLALGRLIDETEVSSLSGSLVIVGRRSIRIRPGLPPERSN